MAEKPKDEHGRPIDHWSQKKDKVKKLVNSAKKNKK
jgi:hypothetical protein